MPDRSAPRTTRPNRGRVAALLSGTLIAGTCFALGAAVTRASDDDEPRTLDLTAAAAAPSANDHAHPDTPVTEASTEQASGAATDGPMIVQTADGQVLEVTDRPILTTGAVAEPGETQTLFAAEDREFIIRRNGTTVVSIVITASCINDTFRGAGQVIGTGAGNELFYLLPTGATGARVTFTDGTSTEIAAVGGDQLDQPFILTSIDGTPDDVVPIGTELSDTEPFCPPPGSEQ